MSDDGLPVSRAEWTLLVFGLFIGVGLDLRTSLTTLGLFGAILTHRVLWTIFPVPMRKFDGVLL